jgi:hypothetical protein
MGTPMAYAIEKMPLVMEGDGVEVRRAPAGDSMALVYISCPQGFDFGPALRGLPHDMCCCEHRCRRTLRALDEGRPIDHLPRWLVLPGYCDAPGPGDGGRRALPERASWRSHLPLAGRIAHLFDATDHKVLWASPLASEISLKVFEFPPTPTSGSITRAGRPTVDGSASTAWIRAAATSGSWNFSKIGLVLSRYGGILWAAERRQFAAQGRHVWRILRSPVMRSMR